MSEAQKIIKYVAIAFALFLFVSIISGFMCSVMAIGNLFTEKNLDLANLEPLKIDQAISNLEIETASLNIIIKTGDTLKMETNSSYLETSQTGSKYSIKEKNHNWLSLKETADLVVYIPTNYEFTDVSIEAGAGKIEIEDLLTKTLDLDLGAGSVIIHKLIVTDTTEIDGGAGEVVVKSSFLNNLDLDMGVGKFTLTSKLFGNSTIDHGVGKLTLNLIGTKEDYQFHVDKGLGSITMDQEKIKEDGTVGTGMNQIKINSGVGNIQIAFIDNT